MRLLDNLTPFGRNENETVSVDNLFNEAIETDVEGLSSDATYKKGFDSFPVFDVSEEEFLSNMESHRQRCRFKSAKVVEYMQKTRYKTPFYIKYTAESTGKQYIRKIK